MKVEKDNEKVIITFGSEKDATRLIKMMDYARYVELTSNMKDVPDDIISELAENVNEAWLNERKYL